MVRADLDLPKFLETLYLESGGHLPNSTFCVMEAVAYVAGEPWSDMPACACPVIARYCQELNDRLSNSDRQRLKVYIPRLVGSVATPDVELKRAFACADWAVRTMAPLALQAAGLKAEAVKLETLPEVNTRAAAGYASDAAASARAAAGSASDAAWYASAAAGYASDAAESALDAAASARAVSRSASNAAWYARAAAGSASDAAASARAAAGYASDAAASARAVSRSASNAAWYTSALDQSFALIDRLLEVS